MKKGQWDLRWHWGKCQYCETSHYLVRCVEILTDEWEIKMILHDLAPVNLWPRNEVSKSLLLPKIIFFCLPLHQAISNTLLVLGHSDSRECIACGFEDFIYLELKSELWWKIIRGVNTDNLCSERSPQTQRYCPTHSNWWDHW